MTGRSAKSIPPIWPRRSLRTNLVPVNPDRAYLWVNPDPELTAPTLETASASGVGVRNEVQAPR